MKISIIIPTYNRPDRLSRLLDSLARQSLPPDIFEVIVVDDGSTVNYSGVLGQGQLANFSYIKQENQGATAARNLGAQHSTGQVLVFIDDDISLYPTTLENLVDEVVEHQQLIVLGALVMPEEIKERSLFATNNGHEEHQPDREVIEFTHCMTGLLAIRREDYCELGGFKDPTGGWPNWDDVDFGYRAHLQGMNLVRLHNAKADHWDYAAEDLQLACRRWEAAGESAPRLFLRYPDLFAEMPMFHDMGPIKLSSDSAPLAIRKAGRMVVASAPVLSMLKLTSRLLEKIYPQPNVLRPLYRWIVGAHIYRGYRRTLHEMDIHVDPSPPIAD